VCVQAASDEAHASELAARLAGAEAQLAGAAELAVTSTASSELAAQLAGAQAASDSLSQQLAAGVAELAVASVSVRDSLLSLPPSPSLSPPLSLPGRSACRRGRWRSLLEEEDSLPPRTSCCMQAASSELAAQLAGAQAASDSLSQQLEDALAQQLEDSLAQQVADAQAQALSQQLEDALAQQLEGAQALAEQRGAELSHAAANACELQVRSSPRNHPTSNSHRPFN
jgi:hypothetical protein